MRDMGNSVHPFNGMTDYPGNLTLWDYYAAAALTGLLANPNPLPASPTLLAEEYADQMIERRKKGMEE